jgi:DNA-binding NarL/FixJ family response regulator
MSRIFSSAEPHPQLTWTAMGHDHWLSAGHASRCPSVECCRGCSGISSSSTRHHLDGPSPPGTNGTDTLIAIRGEFSQARIIMLTTSDSDRDIQRALRAGASAYILKSMPKSELLGVIRSVHAGRRHIPPEVAARLAEHLGDDDLTTRELEVLRIIRDGYRNKQIADQLSISETTVNFHIKNLVDKLQANDRTHAVTIALRRGLLQI